MVGAHSCITMKLHNRLKLIKRVVMTQPNEPEEDVTARTVRVAGVMAAVLSYFDKHPNQVLHIGEISEAVGFPSDKVRGAINNIKTANKAGAKKRLKVELQGQAWIWRSGPTDGTTLDTLYVKAYESKSGKILVEDE